MSPSTYLRYLFLPALVIFGSWLGGYFNFLVPMICFGIHPILGMISKKNTRQIIEKKGTEKQYRMVAILFVPVLLFTTAFMLTTFKEVKSTLLLTGMLLSTGIMNGILGFTLAHEFIHQKEWSSQLSGFLLLMQNNYLHYKTEHIKGHHVYACTENDPHTAVENESIYQFLPRAIGRTWFNAWKIEARPNKKQRWPAFSNRLIGYAMIHLLLWVLVYLFFGVQGLIFFLGQSLVAILLLHITNYLQHYGLSRHHHNQGTLEKAGEHHAWKTRSANDGLNLFQLENHADHHMHPNRPYFELEPHDGSPEMPAGYSGMILLALWPPAWFRVMNARIPKNLPEAQFFGQNS